MVKFVAGANRKRPHAGAGGGCGGLLMMFALLGMVACRAALAQDWPQQIGAGELLVRDGNEYVALMPLATDVQITVSAMIARVSVTQTFRNASSNWIEASYALPLPGDAAVDRLKMHIGERVIEGEIHERQQAEQIYKAARDAGQQASLVSQQRANLFTTRVANVPPGEAVKIEVGYLQTAHYDSGRFSLRFPMTLTPRYTPSGATQPAIERTSLSASRLPLRDADSKSAITAPIALEPAAVSAASVQQAFAANVVHEATLHITLTPGMPLAAITSSSHRLQVVHDKDHYTIETAETRVQMDRDFVLSWQPETGSEPTVAALTETLDGATYALLMILPPAEDQPYRPVPRELIYVIDTSGSMGGESIREAKRALLGSLDHLTSTDRLNIFQFNSQTSSLYRASMPVSRQTRDEAMRYVEGLEANGGTEMAPAIHAALSEPAPAGYLRQVVFLTDGAVSNEQALFGDIDRQLGDARLFTVGIGSAPNSWFMRKAAQFGRGTYVHIGQGTDIAASMNTLFDKLDRVALKDVGVNWPKAAEFYPLRIRDLYAGEPIIVTAAIAQRLAPGEALSVEVSGHTTTAPWSRTVHIAPGSASGIAALWARHKIEYLMASRVQGADENMIRTMVVDVALQYHLVSKYTSFVAVDRTTVRADSALLAQRTVPNMVPAGAAYGALPQTATLGPLLRLAGLVILAAAWLWFGLNQASRHRGLRRGSGHRSPALHGAQARGAR